MHKQFMRIASFAVAITFQVVLWTDDAGLHGCPIHDAIPVATEMASSMQSLASSHGAVHHAERGAHADGHEHVCTCVGSCQGTGSTALLPVASAAQPLPVTAPACQPVTAAARELPTPPAFLLPYAQGPPHLA